MKDKDGAKDERHLSSHVSRLTFLPPRLSSLPALVLATLAQFSARAASVMIWSYLGHRRYPGRVGPHYIRVLGFFAAPAALTPLWPAGLPGLSYLTPFLLLGLISVLRTGALFSRLVALWWLIGISPSIIAIEAPHPYA
jgi:hypothetical protein